MKRDWTTIVTGIGTAATVIGFMWAVMAGFKSEIRSDLNRIDSRMDAMDSRIFWLATGRDLSEVIKEEHLAKDKGCSTG